MTRTCTDCAKPITIGSTGRCVPCANRRKPPLPKKPMPDGFADFAKGKTLSELALHYGKCRRTVNRWRVECGLPERISRGAPAPKRPIPEDFTRKAREMTRTQLREHYSTGRDIVARWCKASGIIAQVRSGPPGAIHRDKRDHSHAGRAADFLRRLGPVIRCDERGRFKADGDHWLRGSTILTAAEVIERAESLGWDADAWLRVAA